MEIKPSCNDVIINCNVKLVMVDSVDVFKNTSTIRACSSTIVPRLPDREFIEVNIKPLMFLLSDLVLVTLSLSACYCKCREHIPAKICY